ncbi:MAG: gamma carbonic anhydrase family protein [Candidatus Thorarchaeota archaeon]|jgi:carbonic anhydrase/acetyltransferase-like protein (isoleucine patch superfamily)
MTIYDFEGRVPSLGKNTYVSHSASVIGKVTIGDECYIAPGAIVKGDYGEIQVGNGCSIQDNVIIHARPDEITIIGNNVTLGHGCIIHNATVKNEAVIGMGAIVSDYALVGEWAIGVPAKVIGNVKEHHKEELAKFKAIYRDLARRYPTGLKKIQD